MSVGHLDIFFGEMSVHVFCLCFNGLFVFWVLSFISSLCILDTDPLLDMSFANIFSYSVGCFLVLLAVFFTVQKLFILM